MDDIFKSELDEVLVRWIHWLGTRKFYTPPLPLNILAILTTQPSGKQPPNAENDALCAAFNLVISGAPDEERLPFLYVYLKQHRPAPIKTLAHELGIDSDTVYQRAHKVAPVYLGKAKELAEMSAKLHREVEDYID